MVEEIKNDNVIELKKEAGELKKASKPRAKKLTGTQITKELNSVKQTKVVYVKSETGTYSFEVQTQATDSQKAEFKTTLTAIIGYTVAEPYFSDLTDEEYKNTIAGLILGATLKQFTSLEVGDTIEEIAQFVTDLGDIGLLSQVSEVIPESILQITIEAGKEVEEETDKMLKQAQELGKQIDALEQK